MRYRHVIWDWNGTILDDSWLCVEILNNSLARRGLKTVTLKEYQQRFGFPVQQYYESLGFDFSRETFHDVSVDFHAYYSARRFECKMQQGVLETLEALKQMGITQSVLSAYEQSMLEQVIDHYGLRKYFTQLVGMNDIYAASKVDNGRLLVRGLTCLPSQVLLVGDTIHDWEVARQIGVDCVLFPGGHQTIERLQTCGVKIIPKISRVATMVCNEKI